MKYNVIIPAAGEGTRLRPLSTNVSKAMVPVNKKPCIQYILDKLDDAEQIVIVDGKFDDIRNYVKDIPNVDCVKQENLLGPRDAIALGVKQLKDTERPLVVWLGDTIVQDGWKFGSDFLLVREMQDQSSWCVVTPNYEYHNKPEFNIRNAKALVGVYSFADGPKACEAFTKTKGYDISDALEEYGTRFELFDVKKWYDIGDISSYHKTCAELLNTKTRYFNEFTYDSNLNLLTNKSNDKPESISHERKWYEGLNEEQKLFVPRYYKKSPWLSLSYEPGTLLSDILIYDDLAEGTIKHIMSKIFDIMENYFWLEPDLDERILINKNVENHWVNKTKERLENVDLSKRKKEEIMYIARTMSLNSMPVKCMHGDLHAGNIIYNTNNDQVVFIDPRGQFGALTGCLGDKLYDLIKLYHDFGWGYGEIINGKRYSRYVFDAFIQVLHERGYDMKQLVAGAVVLFATMIPLHKNEKHKKEFLHIVNSYEYTDE